MNRVHIVWNRTTNRRKIMNNYATIGINEELLHDKSFDYRFYISIKLLCTYSPEYDCLIFFKDDLLSFLQKNSSLSKYKIKKASESLSDKHIIENINRYIYKVQNEPTTTVKINSSRAYSLIDCPRDMAAKTYCYLLWQFNLYRKCHESDDCYFTAADILRVCGYNHRINKNYKMVNQTLSFLEENDIIRYSHQSCARPGYQGKYKKLYNIN